MADRDSTKSGLGSSVSGIPTRSRLPGPTIRTRIAPSGTATPAPSTSRAPVSSLATSSSSRPTPTTSRVGQAAPSRTITSKTSLSSLKPQKSNTNLRASTTTRPPVPSLPATRAPGTRSTAGQPPARSSPSTSRTTRPAASSSRQNSSSASTPTEPSPENGFSASAGSAGLSMREQIAARRAALKKGGVTASASHSSSGTTAVGRGSNFSASTRGGGSGFGDWGAAGPDDNPLEMNVAEDADDLLGRPTIRQAVIKALQTGNLNLMSRELPALPNSLYSLHLGITPAPLANASPTKDAADDAPSGVNRWEAMDLTVLKAGDNEIHELQEEFGLFGSLKNVDFHKNKLSTLPTSISELTNLTHLDLSHCRFTSIPVILSVLPQLTVLNLSHNALETLSFVAITDSQLSELQGDAQRKSEFYTPSNPDTNHPYPSLQTFLASDNSLTAESISLAAAFPHTLSKLDLNNNPLTKRSSPSSIVSLFDSLGRLPALKGVHMRSTGLNDAVLSSCGSSIGFSSLEALDMGDNEGLSEECVRRTLLGTKDPESIAVGTHLDILLTTTAAAALSLSRGPSGGSKGRIHLVIGKHVVKEAWEVELERRSPAKRGYQAPNANANGQTRNEDNAPAADDDEDAFGFGRKEVRVRRSAAASGRAVPASASGSGSGGGQGSRGNFGSNSGRPEQPSTAQVHGYPSPPERERAHESDPAAPRDSSSRSAPDAADSDTAASSSTRPSSKTPPLDRYYDAKTRTLTLPSVVPQTRRGVVHKRSQSLFSSSTSANPGDAGGSDILAPPQTFPHYLIVDHSWAATLRTLVLSNRRLDVSFMFASALAGSIPLVGDGDESALSSSPATPGLVLPAVEELRVDGCKLASRVKITYQRAPDTSPVSSSSNTSELDSTLPISESLGARLGSNGPSGSPSEVELLPTLRRIFPALEVLDLSYNAMTTLKGVSSLFLGPGGEGEKEASDESGGVTPGGGGGRLKTLRVRGNKLDEAALEELVDVGRRIRDGDAGVAASWRGVEIDLCENDIGKLPGALGWLPLDVLLVESNAFRVPNRRVWERDGTKGLLAFLRASGVGDD